MKPASLPPKPEGASLRPALVLGIAIVGCMAGCAAQAWPGVSPAKSELQLNSLETVISDITLPHEGKPDGRSLARYLLSVAADCWLNRHAN
jgi:hypothetical protein